MQIHWLDGEDDNADGRGINVGFWRYVKKIKARRQEQE